VNQPTPRPGAEHPPPALGIDDSQLADLGQKVVFFEFTANELLLKLAIFLFRIRKMHLLFLKHEPWAGSSEL
jgi:hypothetical protein